MFCSLVFSIHTVMLVFGWMTMLVRLTQLYALMVEMSVFSGTTIWAILGLSLSANWSLKKLRGMSCFHTTPFVLVIQAKFACVVSVAASAIRAIAIVFIVLILFLVVRLNSLFLPLGAFLFSDGGFVKVKEHVSQRGVGRLFDVVFGVFGIAFAF